MSFNDFRKPYFGDEFRMARLNSFHRLGRIPRTEVDDTDYTLLIDDVLVAFTALTEPRVVNLPPAASMVADGANNKVNSFIIKDEALAAGTHNITLTPAMGETIEGAGTYVMSNDGESVTFYTSGTDWFVLNSKI